MAYPRSTPSHGAPSQQHIQYFNGSVYNVSNITNQRPASEMDQAGLSSYDYFVPPQYQHAGYWAQSPRYVYAHNAHVFPGSIPPPTAGMMGTPLNGHGSQLWSNPYNFTHSGQVQTSQQFAYAPEASVFHGCRPAAVRAMGMPTSAHGGQQSYYSQNFAQLGQSQPSPMPAYYTYGDALPTSTTTNEVATPEIPLVDHGRQHCSTQQQTVSSGELQPSPARRNDTSGDVLPTSTTTNEVATPEIPLVGHGSQHCSTLQQTVSSGELQPSPAPRNDTSGEVSPTSTISGVAKSRASRDDQQPRSRFFGDNARSAAKRATGAHRSNPYLVSQKAEADVEQIVDLSTPPASPTLQGSSQPNCPKRAYKRKDPADKERAALGKAHKAEKQTRKAKESKVAKQEAKKRIDANKMDFENAFVNAQRDANLQGQQQVFQQEAAAPKQKPVVKPSVEETQYEDDASFGANIMAALNQEDSEDA